MTGLKLILIERWYSKERSDSDLARLLEVDKSIVSRWINGVSEPSLPRKIQIARVLGVDSRLLWPDEAHDG